MKMNKNFRSYLIAWTMIFIAYNLIIFTFDQYLTGAFMAGYLFSLVSFGGHLVCMLWYLNENKLNKLFYNISLLLVAQRYFVLLFIASIACMAIPTLSNLYGTVICFAITAFAVMQIVKARIAIDVVEEIDEKIIVKTSFIKSLTMDAEGLISKAKTEEVRKECKKVYESVRYSDPMSSEELADVESDIITKFSELEQEVIKDNLDKVKETSMELIILIEDRNRRCKGMK